MKTSKIALLIYIVSCIIAVVADIFKNNTVLLLSEAFIIPSLAFYYFVEAKKINLLLCLILLFSFIGDSIGLMDFDNEILFLLVPFFISNVFLLIVMIRNLERFKFQVFNLLAMIIISVFLSFLWYSVVDLFSLEEDIVIYAVEIFGASLFFLAFFASYNVIFRVNLANLCLMIATACVLISDVFYVIFNFQNQLVVLDSIHFAAQMVSYFFIVKYVLLKEESILN